MFFFFACRLAATGSPPLPRGKTNPPRSHFIGLEVFFQFFGIRPGDVERSQCQLDIVGYTPLVVEAG